jgi:hypothetical protein
MPFIMAVKSLMIQAIGPSGARKLPSLPIIDIGREY